MNIRTCAFVFGLVLAGLAVGCSSQTAPTATSSTSPSSPSSSAGASCSDVCAAVADKCGGAPGNCESTCAGFSAQTRACIIQASSCSAIDACGRSEGASSDSENEKEANEGTKPADSDDPCAACSDTQFCVSMSSVASEIGCFDAPSTCNGSSTSICPCLYSAPNSPCSKGTKSCSEGLANRVSCL